MKKAIITFGVGYGFDDLKYFIYSCNRYAPHTDIFLFVGDNIETLRTQCADYPQVHLVRYHERLIPKIISRLLIRIPLISKAYPHLLTALYKHTFFSKPLLNALTVPLVQFMVKRFFVIQQFLQKLPHQQIMLTDVRDVLLQADPFQNVRAQTIITGVEPVTNEQSEMNSRWILKTFSPVEFAALRHQLVACAGVTIGSRRAIDQYVSEMLDEVYANLAKITGMLGADQAIHIKLFYEKLAGLDKQFEANGTGLIATLHFSSLHEFDVSQGRISNSANGHLAVVHQYDRHPHLASALRAGLGQNNKESLVATA